MKRSLVVIFLAAITLIFIVSCNKSNLQSTYYMSASLGKTAFNATNCTAFMQGSSLTIQGGNFKGTTLQYPYISLSVAGFNNTPGTFPIDGINNHAALDSTAAWILIANSGYIDITSVSSNLVTGSFTFICNDGLQVDNGMFSAQLQ